MSNDQSIVLHYAIIIPVKKWFPPNAFTWTEIYSKERTFMEFVFEGVSQWNASCTSKQRVATTIQEVHGKDGDPYYILSLTSNSSDTHAKDQSTNSYVRYPIFEQYIRKTMDKTSPSVGSKRSRSILPPLQYIFEPYIEFIGYLHKGMVTIEMCEDLLHPRYFQAKMSTLIDYHDAMNNMRTLTLESNVFVRHNPLPWPQKFKIDVLPSLVALGYTHVPYAHVLDLIRQFVTPLLLENRTVPYQGLSILSDLFIYRPCSLVYPIPLISLRKWLEDSFTSRQHCLLSMNQLVSSSTVEIKSEEISPPSKDEDLFYKWVTYQRENLVKVMCMTPNRLCEFFCLQDAIFLQWTENTHVNYFHLRGPSGSSKEFILNTLMSLSIPNTFRILDENTAKDMTKLSHSYQFYYSKGDYITRKSIKTIIDTHINHRNPKGFVNEMAIDNDPNRKRMTMKPSHIPMSIVTTVNGEKSKMRKEFYIMQVYPNGSRSEIDDFVQRQHVIEKTQKDKIASFKLFTMDLQFLVQLNHIAITIGVCPTIDVLFGRFVISQLIRSFTEKSCLIVITSRDIEHILNGAINKTIVKSWLLAMNSHGKPEWGIKLVPLAQKHQYLTLETLAWSFAQHVNTLKNTLIEDMFGGLYTKYFKMAGHIQKLRRSLVGSEMKHRGKSGYTKSPLDLMALYYGFTAESGMDRFGSFHVVDEESKIVDLNYIEIRSKDLNRFISLVALKLPDSSMVTEKELKDFFTSPSPMVKVNRVLPYVSASVMDTLSHSLFGENRNIKKKLDQYVEKMGYNYATNRNQIEKEIERIFKDELEILSKFVRDGEYFHEKFRTHLYSEKDGLPLFKYKNEGHVFRVMLLTECFEDSHSETHAEKIKECIEELSNLNYGAPKKVPAFIDNEIKQITIPATTSPHLILPSECPDLDFSTNSQLQSRVYTQGDKMFFKGIGFDEFSQMYASTPRSPFKRE